MVSNKHLLSKSSNKEQQKHLNLEPTECQQHPLWFAKMRTSSLRLPSLENKKVPGLAETLSTGVAFRIHPARNICAVFAPEALSASRSMYLLDVPEFQTVLVPQTVWSFVTGSCLVSQMIAFYVTEQRILGDKESTCREGNKYPKSHRCQTKKTSLPKSKSYRSYTLPIMELYGIMTWHAVSFLSPPNSPRWRSDTLRSKALGAVFLPSIPEVCWIS